MNRLSDLEEQLIISMAVVHLSNGDRERLRAAAIRRLKEIREAEDAALAART